MNLRITSVFAALALSTVAFAQADDAFQVRYASNLAIGDSVINMTNAGATAPADMCVNVYTFAPDEQLVSCCSCRVTPNALQSLSVKSDLISNTLTPAVENAVVIKLLASAPAGPTCNAAAPGALVRGMLAFGTTLHAIQSPNIPAGTYVLTETPFQSATLSANELQKITSFCGFIQANGSGYGICKSCQQKGLGADKQ